MKYLLLFQNIRIWNEWIFMDYRNYGLASIPKKYARTNFTTQWRSWLSYIKGLDFDLLKEIRYCLLSKANTKHCGYFSTNDSEFIQVSSNKTDLKLTNSYIRDNFIEMLDKKIRRLAPEDIFQ